MIVRVGGSLPVEVLAMPVLRKIPLQKIPVWIVLASYLFANTAASSLHDHGNCCGQSDGVHHDTADCAALDSHQGVGAKCCHHDHGHKHVAGRQAHRHDAGQNHESCRTSTDQPGGHSTSHSSRQEKDRRSPHEHQHCVVCDFLALASLSTPQATLDLAGETLPEFVVLCVLPVSSTTVETHLARGPPAA
jgi:hypothetical protein